MSSKFEYDVGEIAQIRIGARIHSGRILSGYDIMNFASEMQNCVILHKDTEFGRDQYFVFLQQDQIQGWVYYYDLEKLNG
jgi:hypothetical protein